MNSLESLLLALQKEIAKVEVLALAEDMKLTFQTEVKK